MTVQLVRLMAKEIAGIYYDQERNDVFRIMNPVQDAYVAKNWPHFVDLARQALVLSLQDATVPEYKKDQIMDALREHSMRAQLPGARSVVQASMDKPDPVDKRLAAEAARQHMIMENK